MLAGLVRSALELNTTLVFNINALHTACNPVVTE